MPPRRKSNRRVVLPGAARFAPPAAAAVPPPQPLATNADAQSAAAPSIIPPPAAATPEVPAAAPITPAVTTTATTPADTTATPTTTTASAAVEATVKRTFFTGLSPSDAPQPAAAVEVPPTAAPTPTPTPTPAVAAEPTVAAAASRSLAARRRASRKRATRGKAVPPTAAAQPMVSATVPDAQPVVDTTAANAPTPAAATSKVFFEALEKQTEVPPAAAAPLAEAAVSDVTAAPQDTPNMTMESAAPVAPAVTVEEVAAPAAPRPRAMGLTQFRKLQKRKRTAKVDLPVVEQPTVEAVPPPPPAAQEVQQAEVAACDEAPSAPAQAEAVSQPPPPPPITASVATVNVVPEPIPAAPIVTPVIDAPMEPAAAAPDAAPARPQRMMSYTTYMKKQQAKNRRMKAAAARTRRKEAVVAKKLAQERAKEAARVAQAAAEEAMAKAEEARAQAELAAAAITAAAEAEAAKIKAAAEVAAAAELAKARQASQEILATSAPTPAAAAVEAVPPTTAEVPLQSPAKAYGRRKRRVFISTPLVPAPPPLAVPEADPSTTIAAEKVEEVLTPAEGQHEAPRAELPVIPDYDENITCVDMPTSVPAPPAVGTRAMMNADRLKRNKKKFFAALEDSEATASAAAEAVEAPVKVAAVEEPTQMEAAPSYEEKTLPSEEPEPQQQPAAAVAEVEAEVDMDVEAAEAVAPAVEPIASAEQQPTAVETEPSAQVEEAEPSTAAEEVAVHEAPTAVAGSPAIDPVFRGRMSSAKFKKLRLLRQQQRRAAMAEAAAATTTSTASYDAEAENVPKAHHVVQELVIDSETLQAAPDTLEAEDAKVVVETAADNGDVAQPLEDVVPRDEPEVTPQTQAAAEAVGEVASAPLEEPAAPAPIAEVARTHTISHRGRKKKSFTQLVAQKAAAADESVAQVEEAAAMGTEVEVEVEAVRPVVEAEQAEAVAAELPMANEQLPSEALPDVEEPVTAPPPQTEAVPAPHDTVNTHTVPEVEEIVPTPVAARSVPEEDRLRRRLSAKKRIKRHSKLAEARREKREAPHNAAADEAAPVLEVPLVPELNAAPPLVEPASETSAETLVRTAALTFPSGFVQVESFTDTELVLLRDNLDRSWDVGLRFDWNMRTLALTLPAFPAADPRQQHPYMQLFRSKPSWFLKEVNGADASQMREVMDSMKKTLRSRFVFKRV